MNYEIFLTTNGQNPILLKKYFERPEFRPVLKQQLKIQGDLRTFEVNQTIPGDNPADQKVIYFVNVLTPQALNYRKTAQTDFIQRTLP